MNERRLQIGLIIVTLIVAAIAVLISRRQISSIAFGQVFTLVPWAFAVAIAASLLQEMLNPVFGYFALHSVGQSTRYLPQFMIMMFSTSANSTVPVPAGIPIRAFLQKKIINIPYTKSASGLLLETIVGYSTVIILAIVTSYLWLRKSVYQQFSEWIQPVRMKAPALATIFIVVILIGLLVFISIRKTKLMTLTVMGFKELIRAKLWPIIGMFSVTALSICLTLLRASMILYAVGINVPYGPLLAILLISRLAGVISLIPMGLGIRDASLAALLLVIGVPATHAVVTAAIDRIIMTTPYLVGSVIATHILGKKLLQSAPNSTTFSD